MVQKSNFISSNSDFNILVADEDYETFKIFSEMESEFNFINVSSDFAIHFVINYEAIDLVILGKRLSNLNDVLKSINKKRIQVLVLGKDIKMPIDLLEARDRIEKALESSKDRAKKPLIKNYIHKIIENNKKNAEASSEKKQAIGKNNIIKLKELISTNETRINEIKKKSRLESDAHIKTIKQKIIVLAKAKGGVGSTSIAISLGFALKRIKTLILDLNFSEGGCDLAYYLDLPKTPNLMFFTEGYNRESMSNSIHKFNESLHILQSPPSYELSKKIDLKDIYTLIEIARKKYTIIIIDLPNSLNELFLGVIDLADILMLVSDCSIGSIGRLSSIDKKYFYDEMEKLMIINRFSKGNGFHLSQNELKDIMNINDLLFIKENDKMKNKYEFKDFNFEDIDCFKNLNLRFLELLTA